MDNYIFITRDFHPLPIADRLLDDGKKVIIGMVQKEEDENTPKGKSDSRLSLYEGILDIKSADDVIEWMKTIKNKDEWFVMFDYGDLWEYSEKALKMGFRKGVFPTEESYNLEKDRQAGKDFAKKNYPDLKVAEVAEFHRVDDALKFLEENPDKIFVLKSEGSNAETVVPETTDPELARRQISGALKTEAKGYERGGFTLEEKIKKPIEITPVMVFWDGVPLFSLVELENKPIGSGNIGRLTGGCQDLCIQTRLDCELNKIAFPPIIYDMAKKQPGISIFDAGLLFDGNDFYFTEFCATRWGFDGLFSEIAMCGDKKGRGSVVRHFDLISKGKNPLNWKFGVSVRLFQTEPNGKEPDMYEGEYTMDWLDEVSDQLFFYCLKKVKSEGDEEERFVSVGYDKDVGCATGAADNIEAAVRMAYQALEGFVMTGAYYRPKFDFLSRAYFTSIMNRYDWLINSELL
jgi:hypothetical protein